jgi:DNA repair protein RadC
LLALDGGRKVSGAFEVSRGTLTSSLVHPREIFQRAILAGAASIIIAHNHPSGALTISEQDRDVTRRIEDVGELIGIPLDDHLIVAESGYVSAR